MCKAAFLNSTKKGDVDGMCKQETKLKHHHMLPENPFLTFDEKTLRMNKAYAQSFYPTRRFSLV